MNRAENLWEPLLYSIAATVVEIVGSVVPWHGVTLHTIVGLTLWGVNVRVWILTFKWWWWAVGSTLLDHTGWGGGDGLLRVHSWTFQVEVVVFPKHASAGANSCKVNTLKIVHYFVYLTVPTYAVLDNCSLWFEQFMSRMFPLFDDDLSFHYAPLLLHFLERGELGFYYTFCWPGHQL